MDGHGPRRADQQARSDADVVIIGGGPAGLTAAIYLARYHLRAIVIDNGRSRAATIPVSHNHAGHPAGIRGAELLDRMRIQAAQYGAVIISGEVAGLARTQTGFVLAAGFAFHAPTVLLATGVRNHRPAMDDKVHDEAVARGLLRYCPVCDGYEVTDRRIGVIGSGSRGTSEALFLRSYSRTITLIAPNGAHALDGEQAAALANAGIVMVDGPARAFEVAADAISVQTAAGLLRFDAIYPALGSRVHSDLAYQLGASLADDGGIVVDAHQRTSIKGLYAAGDVVLGLDQIGHAMGEAGVAATAIRNDRAAVQSLWR